ncbi:hypothetical protein EJ04DRAFT_596905 [Polyplosphaeria fusca]|uniref:Uncharacterized protein n=1 Tax=Polyplosphaeria fusca TaxID=682080 RepID=A0A9P4QZL8_9PLEO|nr:hypothetical protein EJ04DRAFT_596905 [Polyplosphaeria fusca]
MANIEEEAGDGPMEAARNFVRTEPFVAAGPWFSSRFHSAVRRPLASQMGGCPKGLARRGSLRSIPGVLFPDVAATANHQEDLGDCGRGLRYLCTDAPFADCALYLCSSCPPRVALASVSCALRHGPMARSAALLVTCTARALQRYPTHALPRWHPARPHRRPPMPGPLTPVLDQAATRVTTYTSPRPAVHAPFQPKPQTCHSHFRRPSRTSPDIVRPNTPDSQLRAIAMLDHALWPRASPAARLPTMGPTRKCTSSSLRPSTMPSATAYMPSATN